MDLKIFHHKPSFFGGSPMTMTMEIFPVRLPGLPTVGWSHDCEAPGHDRVQLVYNSNFTMVYGTR